MKLPHAESIIVPANKSNRFTYHPQKRGESGSRCAPLRARSLVNISMMSHVLESQLETKLYSARPMRIERVQEGSPGDTIRSATFKPG